MTAPPRTTEVTASALRDYRTPESLPRPGGRLTKEDLDPLVKDAGEGNPAAIHSLLQMIEPVVVRYCRARMGGRDLSYLSADDVAQEVCLAVLKALPDYQDRGGSFLYLVHAIAANKVADAYRAVARDRSEPVPELPERPLVAGNEPESHALHLDLGARLGRLLATLPRVQQEILTLRIAVGFSATETAEALGISPGNVRVTQHRALTRLRGMIRDDEF
jgi:RNA polymerase sigma-70 factor (ECF subfamily)